MSGSALPSWCSTNWKPQPFQEKVLACESGIAFAVGGIGSGKSEAAALKLLKWALQHPRRADGNPTKWYIVGPEFSLIRLEQFAKVLNHIRRLEEIGYGTLVKRVVYGMDPRIVLRDGQVLLGRSGDQYRRMEGQEVDGAWIDEAQRQPEMSFAIALTRMRSSDDVRMVVSASPEDTPGWVWRFINGKDKKYNRLRKRLLSELGTGVRIFRWHSRANAANEAGVLSVISAALDAVNGGAAAQKIGGRFPGTDEAPAVSAIDYARAFIGDVSLPDADIVPFSMGVDIGETEDFTWITILSRTGYVLHMERWNAGSPGVPRAGFYPYAEARIEKLARAWRVRRVVIDTGKAGKPVQQSLEAKLVGTQVIGVDTSSRKQKSEAIEALALSLASVEIKITKQWTTSDGRVIAVEFVEQLRKELEELNPIERGFGHRSWDHPPGGHDDGVVSLALARHGWNPKTKVIEARRNVGSSLNNDDEPKDATRGYGGKWTIGR